MKLYATTKSDRATKGQGGNEYIDIELKAEWGKDDYRFFGRLHFDLFTDSQNQNHFRLYFQPENDKSKNELLKHIILPTQSKGNKKKDDSGKDGICVACRGKNPEGCTYC